MFVYRSGVILFPRPLQASRIYRRDKKGRAGCGGNNRLGAKKVVEEGAAKKSLLRLSFL
jgi:hypothetical protein